MKVTSSSGESWRALQGVKGSPHLRSLRLSKTLARKRGYIYVMLKSEARDKSIRLR